MLRTRHGCLVAVIGLVLALVAACKKDENAGTAGGKTGTAEKPAVDDLSLLPVDSEAVIGVNFAQIAQSGLWKQFVEPKMKTMNGEASRKINEFKDKCGYDVVGSLKSVSIGGKGFDSPKPAAVIVVHGLDKTKSWACLDKMKDDIAKEGELTRDGDVGVFKSKDGEQTAFTFVDDSTAILVNGDQANPAGVKAVAAGGSTLKTSQAFVSMYSKVKTGDSLWFLVNGKPLEKLGALGVKASAAFGSLNVTDGLTLDMRIRVDSPDAATQLANLLKTQGQGAAKMFDQIDFTPDGNEVKCTVVLSSQKLQSLMTTLGGMFGALGGSGGH